MPMEIQRSHRASLDFIWVSFRSLLNSYCIPTKQITAFLLSSYFNSNELLSKRQRFPEDSTWTSIWNPNDLTSTFNHSNVAFLTISWRTLSERCSRSHDCLSFEVLSNSRRIHLGLISHIPRWNFYWNMKWFLMNFLLNVWGTPLTFQSTSDRYPPENSANT